MARRLPNNSGWLVLAAILLGPLVAGCATAGRDDLPDTSPAPATLARAGATPSRLPPFPTAGVRLASWQQADEAEVAAEPLIPPGFTQPVDPPRLDTLSELVQVAETQNPGLRALQQEVAAAQARVRHVDKLPDPTLGASIFASPIETAAGSQTANMTVTQRFPWLQRLDAQAQQAWFEALAAEQVYETVRLKVVGDVRALWFRLYVIGMQIKVNQANQELLQSLIRIANARVAAGGASQGDVLLGTLELSRLAEQLLTLRQQLESAKAELNRAVGRSSDDSISVPQHLVVSLPKWSHAQLRQLAIEQQPDIAAAVLRVDASRWGIEIARLQRRPDISFNATWYAIDDDRTASDVVDIGRDAWSVGVQVSVPIWHKKYDAIEQEATQRHFASQATVDDTINRYDALLRDLLEQARAASETAELYRTTILPQAEQTLKADQESYSTGRVEFDRVVRDLRNLLTLQLEHHRAVGRLATAMARIRQAVGEGLDNEPANAEEVPAP